MGSIPILGTIVKPNLFKMKTLKEVKTTEIKKVFRIEHPTDRDGMWYTKEGLLRKKIHILCPNGIAKDFPMPLNLELHRKGGHVWQSAGKSVENMNLWFTALDAINLYNNGFKLFEFETTMFQELDMEILFCRQGVIKQKEIPLESIWDISNKKINQL